MENFTAKQISEFQRAYVECALWSSSGTDPETGEDANLDDYEPAEETVQALHADALEFIEAHADLLTRACEFRDMSMHGHDFWLTQNGHGAGFWDRGYPGTLGDELTRAAKTFSPRDLYLGDDSQVYA